MRIFFILQKHILLSIIYSKKLFYLTNGLSLFFLNSIHLLPLSYTRTKRKNKLLTTIDIIFSQEKCLLLYYLTRFCIVFLFKQTYLQLTGKDTLSCFYFSPTKKYHYFIQLPYLVFNYDKINQVASILYVICINNHHTCNILIKCTTNNYN